jgi:DNA ligase-1
MQFQDLAMVYKELEKTTSRLEMTSILAAFFKQADCATLHRVIYLTQGQLYPDFYPQKLGMADRLLLKTLSMSTGMKDEDVQELWLKEGDPGIVAQKAFAVKKQRTLFSEPLTLDRVYENLEKIAVSEGSGSQDVKMKLLAEILNDASAEEAKFIARMVTGRMRLGVAAMTVIDALAVAFASKEDRDVIERAFNISSDLGRVGETLCREGIESIREMKVEVGSPMRAMLAERLPSPQECKRISVMVGSSSSRAAWRTSRSSSPTSSRP